MSQETKTTETIKTTETKPVETTKPSNPLQHEYDLIAAAVGERGMTDASTPLYIRVQNLVAHWDEIEKDRAAARELVQEVSNQIGSIKTATEPTDPKDGPIALTKLQEVSIRTWAADDRLWTTQENVETNLRTFARVILSVRRD